MPHMEGIFINGEKAKFHPEDIYKLQMLVIEISRISYRQHNLALKPY